MALQNFGVGVIISARDQASRVISLLSQNFGVFNQTGLQTQQILARLTPIFGQLAVGIGAAAAGMKGFQATVIGPVNAAADLETLITRIGVKASDLSKKDLADLNKGFLELSATLPLSAEDLGRVGIVAAQLGVAAGKSGAEGVKAIKEFAFATAQFARITEFSEEEAGIALGRMSTAFGISTGEINKLSSALAVAGDSTAASAKEINDVVKRFGPFAHTLGVGADQAIAFATTLRQFGVEAELAGSGLGRLFSKALENSAEFAKVMGISQQEFREAFGRDASGTIVKFFDAVNKSGKDLPVVMKEIGLEGTRNIQVFSVLASKMGFLRENLNNIGQAYRDGTAAAEKFEASTKDFNSAMDTLRGSLKNVAIVIGQAFLPIATMLVNGLNTIVAAFLKLPTPIQKFIAFGGALLSIGLIIAGVVLAVKALTAGLALLGTTVGGVVSTVLAPLAPILGGIAAAIGALIVGGDALVAAWESNFGGIRDAVMPTIERISLAIRSLFTLFKEGEIRGDLAKQLLGDSAVFGFVETVSQAVASVQALLRGFAAGVIGAFRNASKAFAPTFARLKVLLTEIGNLFLTVFNDVAEVLGLKNGDEGIDVLETIGAVLGALLGGVVGQALIMFGDMLRIVLEIGIAVVRVAKVWHEQWMQTATFLKTVFIGVFNAIIAVVNGVVRAIFEPINSLMRLLNDLLDLAAGAASLLGSDDLARQFQSAKFDVGTFAGPQIEPFGVTTPEATPAATASPPGSAPVQQQAPQQQDVLISELRAALGARQDQAIEAEVMLDGRAVGRVTGLSESASNAAVGAFRPTFQ